MLRLAPRFGKGIAAIGLLLATANPATSAVNSHSIDLEAGSSQSLGIADGSQTGLDLVGSDLTFEMWVKVESVGSFIYPLLSKGDCDSGQSVYRLIYRFAPSRLSFEVSDSAGNTQVDVAHDLGTGTWRHVAATYDDVPGEVKFYVDGVQTGAPLSFGRAIVNTSQPFLVGTEDLTCGAEHFDGLIDEVRVWNDVRTASEIADNRRVQLNGSEPNLVAYWKLDNTLLDETSNNNDLTNTSGASFFLDVPFPPIVPIGRSVAPAMGALLLFAGFASLALRRGKRRTHDR